MSRAGHALPSRYRMKQCLRLWPGRSPRCLRLTQHDIEGCTDPRSSPGLDNGAQAPPFVPRPRADGTGALALTLHLSQRRLSSVCIYVIDFIGINGGARTLDPMHYECRPPPTTRLSAKTPVRNLLIFILFHFINLGLSAVATPYSPRRAHGNHTESTRTVTGLLSSPTKELAFTART
jgi:hypothetical protein